MDYTAITNMAAWQQATVAILLIFGALAALDVTVRGCLFLVDAIGNDDGDEDTDDDAQDDT